jgi:DNA-binding IclR family transcriptional regulator
LYNERHTAILREYPLQKGDKLAKQGTSTVQSVERAIAILKSFSQEKPERGVNELSRELGLHKSTVSRLMMTLERGGLLTRNPENERYRLGVDLIGMAAQVVSYMDVRQVARPFLRQLAETCQETVNLVVLDAGQVINLEQFVPPAREVKNIGRVGRRMPPHCTAAGKVLLAHLSQEELDQILQTELETFTPHTITNPHQLQQELMQVHKQGYAVSQEELEKGLNVIAAPIYEHTGQVAASISIAGPAYRITPELVPELAARLMHTAAQISERLGYGGSTTSLVEAE